MSFFDFNEEKSIGEVRGVDTNQIVINVSSSKKLLLAKVGHLVAVQGQDSNEWLIGMINRVWRDAVVSSFIETEDIEEITQEDFENNSVKITLVGTFLEKYGLKKNYFTRAILSLPDINREVFSLDQKNLEKFMSIIANSGLKQLHNPLEIGHYALDKKAKAFLDANKLFQRHAALLGSTGSGKSWTVASLLEQAQRLEKANILLFDLHGEYNELPNMEQYRVAGPGDLINGSENTLFLPFWLLTFEELQSLIIDHSEQTAPNQLAAILEALTELKKESLIKDNKSDVLERFTIDSPIPFTVGELIEKLEEKNNYKIETGTDTKGNPKYKQGPLYDKLTRLIIRLKSKVEDRRYGFLFQYPQEYSSYESLHQIAESLLGHGAIENYRKSGIKVIDFSEVPSDVLPIIISLVARLIYQIQFWADAGENNDLRHPVLLICDEAHLYLPSSSESINVIQKKSVQTFERIAKEGRKYGVGLFIVSQRPSDVSTTILSQCNNIISLRLTNDKDKSVVKSLLPDTLEGLLSVLSGLEIGEAVVVGDSTLLPTRIVLNKPNTPPKSATIDFWDRWTEAKEGYSIIDAVENLRKQSRN
ncbi:ATP-binding protein [Bacillus sp. 1P06AnD]|uniref:ATP-binding protein n=1 Tax=Bacillus sp. 1P06AnD TaxID=3132208 RepID=UPI0039A3E76F